MQSLKTKKVIGHVCPNERKGIIPALIDLKLYKSTWKLVNNCIENSTELLAPPLPDYAMHWLE